MSLFPNSDAPIGVFDSGVGGLTVVRALMRHLPNERLIYFGDTARVPYGTKSRETIRKYAADDTRFLLSHRPKLIVIACNTVSALALDIVSALALDAVSVLARDAVTDLASAASPHTESPRVETLGVIKAGAELAVKKSRSKCIGVIGTSATISSGAYQTEITALDAAAQVFSKACPLFVPLAEEGFLQHDATRLIAKEYLSPLLAERIDTLVLGCTHYPILRPVLEEVIEEAAGNRVEIIDSGEAVARQVAQTLQESNLLSKQETMPPQFFVSDLPQKFQSVAELFLGVALGRIEVISV